MFPAAFLAALENRHLGGCSVARYFDLIAGTSTGGIIALALGARLRADEIRDLYVKRGCEVFPPVGDVLVAVKMRGYLANSPRELTVPVEANQR